MYQIEAFKPSPVVVVVDCTLSSASPTKKKENFELFSGSFHKVTTLNLTDNFSTYPGMAGTVDILDQDSIKQSAFMDIQQQAAAAGLSMSHHQPYSSLRSAYGGNPQSHDAFASQQRNSLAGAYPFTMNNSPLHNNYSHPGSHPYLGSYAPPPPNINSCAPCPSPPRETKLESSK